MKPIDKKTIEALEKNGNTCSDWKKIKIATGFNPERVKNSQFFGNVSLGKFEKTIEVEDGVSLPSGIYNSAIINSKIGSDCLINHVNLLANYNVKDEVIILNCGEISTKKGATFGQGIEIPVAIETGGREVRIYSNLTIPEAAKIATNRENKKLLRSYNKKVERVVKKIKSNTGTIEKGAQIKNTPKVKDAYIGESAVIDNANLVLNSTILSNKEEAVEISDGAYVRNSIIQWGCEVTSGAIVDESCLTEHSHVERHGKVTKSIIGPNSGVAEGECTASLLGPFVGFHHQALLIATFWPEGKGNIGYGANVGSNHTSKAPDQELWAGEGTFFGLGVNIKFPSDFTKAPYSIIATAVNALPQKVTFPFSMINSPSTSFKDISPAYNDIMPGWLLSDNIFTLKRNEAKYIKRNKARRSDFVFEVFRPDIVALMIDARNRLRDFPYKKDVYTEKDILGLGKNYLLESSRQIAISAYTFYIRYYALLGLKRKLEEILQKKVSKKTIKKLLTASSKDKRWDNERKILLTELPNNDVAANLRFLLDNLEKIANDVQSSKEKDDKRGRRIIPDYPQAHPPAAEDSFVKETWAETEKKQKAIENLLKKI